MSGATDHPGPFVVWADLDEYEVDGKQPVAIAPRGEWADTICDLLESDWPNGRFWRKPFNSVETGTLYLQKVEFLKRDDGICGSVVRHANKSLELLVYYKDVQKAKSALAEQAEAGNSKADIGQPEAEPNDDGETVEGVNRQTEGDVSDYVSATEIRTKHTPAGVVLSQKRLKRFLAIHPGIRQRPGVKKDGTPRKNRLLVHLADWHKHRDALVEWDNVDTGDPVEEAPLAEISARYAKIHAKVRQDPRRQ